RGIAISRGRAPPSQLGDVTQWLSDFSGIQRHFRLGGGRMEFRLSYRGALRATQLDPKPGTNQRTRHWQLKHEMRLAFHHQLKHIWAETKFIAGNQTPDGSKPYHRQRLAQANKIPPWSFVPLVTAELELLCGVDI